MRLNLGMMVDGNARSTFVNVMRKLDMRPEDLPERKEEAIKLYMKELPSTYIRNARWCIDVGESLFSRTEGSEYVIFVYNMTNRSRGHFSSIEKTILETGGELIKRLSCFGDVCLAGSKSEKDRWMALYPELKDVNEGMKGHRTVILTGYQRDSGEDAGVRHIRPLDFFVRSTQLRMSGMYLPCMDDTHFCVLNHIPYKYDPSAFVDRLVTAKRMDEEHDELNVYSGGVYETWLKHESKPPSVYITSNALPPEEHIV
ncbi:Uncharacterised protein [uncultured archaeon]|nr:Uncharacterised protein [uncultured archaeon]